MSFEDQSCQRQFRFNGFFTRRENPTTFHDMNWIWVCCRYLSLSKKSLIVLKLCVLETHFKLYGYHNWHLKTSFVFFWEEENRVPFLQSLMGDNGHDHTLNENNWPIHKHKDIYINLSVLVTKTRVVWRASLALGERTGKTRATPRVSTAWLQVWLIISVSVWDFVLHWTGMTRNANEEQRKLCWLAAFSLPDKLIIDMTTMMTTRFCHIQSS